MTSTKLWGGGANVLDEAHEEVFPASLDVIFWEAPPPLQIAKKGVEWVKKGWKWSCKVGERMCCKVDTNCTPKEGA